MKAEESINMSEKRYRKIVENMHEFVCEIKPDGEFQFVNKPFSKATGYTIEEIIGKNFFKFVHPDDTAPTLEHCQVLMETKKPIRNCEYRFRKRDGGYLNLVTNGDPIYDSDGNLKAVLQVSFDITGRKKAEDSLKRIVDELEVVHEIDKTILSQPDLSTLLRFIVRKARKFTGADVAFYSFVEGDIIRHHTFSGMRTNAFKNMKLKKGSGLGWLVVERKKPMVVEDFLSDKRLNNPPYAAVKKEGLVSFSAVPFMSGKGEPLGVLYVASRKKTAYSEEQIRTLVTLASQTAVAIEHARLYDEMRNAFEELKTLDRVKRNIISNVSHELRTPLTIAKSAMELSQDGDSENNYELLKTGINALVRQNLIIGDLLEAAYIEKTSEEIELEEVELSHIIEDVSKEFGPLAIQRRISVELPDITNIPGVMANPRQLGHVLRNLFSNAIKFNLEGGKIEINVREKGEFVMISFKDTGIGIEKKHISKVFDSFYQADATSTRAYGGAGLGLSVVKGIIEAHGGEIRVKSKSGKGSTFSFTLPSVKGG